MEDEGSNPLLVTKCCSLEKGMYVSRVLINHYNTEDFSSSKLTYPKVMRKHLVPYVHKVDRNGTSLFS